MAVTTQHTQRFVKFVNRQLDVLKEEKRTMEGAADDFIHQVQSEVDTWVKEGLANHSTFDEITNRIQQAITFFITKSVEISEISVREDSTQVIPNRLAKLEEAVEYLKTKTEQSQEDRQQIERKLKEMSILQETNCKMIENLSDKNVESKNNNVEQFMDLEKQIQNIKSNFDSMLESVKNANGRLNKLEDKNKSVNVSINEVKTEISSFRSCSNDALMSIQDLSKSVERTNQHYNEMSHKMNQLEISTNLMSAQHTEQFENMRSYNQDKVEDLFCLVCQLLTKRLTPLEELREHLNTTLNTRKQMTLKADGHEEKIMELSTKISEIKSKFCIPDVGFYVYCKFNFKVGLCDVNNFGEVYVNYGNHFDSSSGEFTAPLNGLYLISVTGTLTEGGVIYVKHYDTNTSDGTKEYRLFGNQSLTFCAKLKATHKVFLKAETAKPVNEVWIDFSCFMIKGE